MHPLVLWLNIQHSIMTYQEQLKDLKWQKKRKEILDRDGHRCRECGGLLGKDVQVHHLLYKKGAMAWQYENNHLVTLCGVCHKTWHDIRNNLDLLLAVDFNTLLEYNSLLKTLHNESYDNIDTITKAIKNIQKYDKDNKGGKYGL